MPHASDEHKMAAEECPSCAEETVGGSYMERTVEDFVRACEVMIGHEQEKIAPDNALVALLCDAVRFSREVDRRGGCCTCTEVEAYGWEYISDADHAEHQAECSFGRRVADARAEGVYDAAASLERFCGEWFDPRFPLRTSLAPELAREAVAHLRSLVKPSSDPSEPTIERGKK